MNIHRFSTNPIIYPHMDQRMGSNINGPSLVRAPSWVAQPLGKYYLYFGHHHGTYIRLAFADHLEGPWQTYEPGVLDLEQSFFEKHIASPDVHVDEDRHEVRLYYHGPLAEADRHGPHGRHAQATRVAISKDGVNFTAQPEVLGASYFRVFRWNGWYYALAMPGILYRSRFGLSGFEEGHNPFPPNMRHAAFLREGDDLRVFYTIRGDCPERILMSTMNLSHNWAEWRTKEPVVMLEPEMDYEGAQLALEPSQSGAILHPVRQLRDPAIFQDGNRDYLLYAVAGEQGIAIAQIEA